MNAEWQKILAEQGVEAASVTGSGGTDAEAVLCPITSEVVLKVTNDQLPNAKPALKLNAGKKHTVDAESFLQAQFSNDIAALPSPGSHLTTWSSPKGRVITLLRVTRISDGYLLKMPAGQLDPVLKRLRMYLLAAKVTIEPRDDLLVAGVTGEKAAAALAGDIPARIDDTCELPGGGWVTRVRGDGNRFTDRFEITAEAAQMAKYWTDLGQVSEAATETTWRLQNIDAGIPSINTATTEAFVLQMLNLQHINGVSFKKGCFPGQEVVARMQYLGKLKRQMVRMQHTGSALPASGDEIYTEARDSAVGKVVDAVSVDGSSCRLLAVMAIAETTSKLYLDKEGTLPVELMQLPYETPVAG